jgi:uncharacterized membrane protein
VAKANSVPANSVPANSVTANDAAPSAAPSVSYILAAPETSAMAIVAFVLTFFLPIIGLVLGYVARNEIDHSGGRLGGRGFATAAIVINWVGIGLAVFGLLIIVIGVAATVPRY